MKIEISTKAMLSAVATVALGVTSWMVLGHIEYGNRLTRLEDSDSNDERQDQELAEIRATMRDLIRLTAELAATHPDSHEGHEPVSVIDASDSPVIDGEMLEPEYGNFRVEQADLESILRGRGIEPAEKRLSDK